MNVNRIKPIVVIPTQIVADMIALAHTVYDTIVAAPFDVDLWLPAFLSSHPASAAGSPGAALQTLEDAFVNAGETSKTKTDELDTAKADALVKFRKVRDAAFVDAGDDPESIRALGFVVRKYTETDNGTATHDPSEDAKPRVVVPNTAAGLLVALRRIAPLVTGNATFALASAEAADDVDIAIMATTLEDAITSADVARESVKIAADARDDFRSSLLNWFRRVRDYGFHKFNDDWQQIGTMGFTVLEQHVPGTTVPTPGDMDGDGIPDDLDDDTDGDGMPNTTDTDDDNDGTLDVDDDEPTNPDVQTTGVVV